jgi:3-oxoacyl-[acyl-carrier protein] reductase
VAGLGQRASRECAEAARCARDDKSDELIERMAKMNPLERLGTPADIAASVAFLAGPDGSWINGQVLRANGGMV